MKYVVIIGDGMADRPVSELGGRTPLQRASTPNMDRMSVVGRPGRVRTVPKGMHPGSDVANLSILGYDPHFFYTGRAPLEAASIGVSLSGDDVAFRCNLVTLKHGDDGSRVVMEDYSSGHITTGEARELILDLDRRLGTEVIKFHPGVSYRHLMVWSGGPDDVRCVPPHDILGKDIAEYLPSGRGGEVLREMMAESVEILTGHPVNRRRLEKGKNPGNSVWFWGQGRKPAMPTFREKYALRGALISAVDLTKGLGIYAGFEILDVPGITGYLDTNYRGKAEAALKALNSADFVYIHVEAPDEAGHSGDCGDKIRAIEDFDSLVVGPVMKGLKEFVDYRVLLLPDHPTPLELRTHTADPVPFILFDSASVQMNEGLTFDERIVDKEGILIFEKGHALMDYFIRGERIP
jgi:2,3-bisphosphoglycerate-independent phosphoglycerate mutase